MKLLPHQRPLHGVYCCYPPKGMSHWLCYGAVGCFLHYVGFLICIWMDVSSLVHTPGYWHCLLSVFLVGDIEWLMENKVQKCVDGHLQCLLCGNQFTQKGSLKRHMREVHTAPTRYRCPICDATFLNRAFNMHIRQSHSSWTDVDYERYRDDRALEWPHWDIIFQYLAPTEVFVFW